MSNTFKVYDQMSTVEFDNNTYDCTYMQFIEYFVPGVSEEYYLDLSCLIDIKYENNKYIITKKDTKVDISMLNKIIATSKKDLGKNDFKKLFFYLIKYLVDSTLIKENKVIKDSVVQEKDVDTYHYDEKVTPQCSIFLGYDSEMKNESSETNETKNESSEIKELNEEFDNVLILD